MSKISGQLLISGHFQDNCEISGISGEMGRLRMVLVMQSNFLLPVMSRAAAFRTNCSGRR